VSFGIALFLTEMCPPILKRPLGTAVELLAAIPSIIYGMWGLFVFAPLFGDYVQPLLQKIFGNLWILGPLFRGAPNGIGMLSAGIILSVMVLLHFFGDARRIRDRSAGLKGIGHASAARPGKWFATSCSLQVGAHRRNHAGLGRALGETMAVTFIIGNAYRISSSLYEPGNSIASALANEFN
jgi:phosphate transport system permease protein